VIADADAKLAELAALCALGRRLPHLATPWEQKLIDEFRSFIESQRTSCSPIAAIAGMQELWRRQDLILILKAAEKLPAAILADREVLTFVDLARRSLATSGR
jgi:hypothetical protein